jgi:hypothetical protein
MRWVVFLSVTFVAVALSWLCTAILIEVFNAPAWLCSLPVAVVGSLIIPFAKIVFD